ncbi:O-methyltransferase-domain-containing protein [Triangularia verruculosa]|uniref:O-methyltransferase-domain-containing protein n=1 Tax=Triangularia verruculosa TaxID=2587418 RepID=A0AAN6XKE0_9PEZI|nr:O-methyltransferase-domain-containing protein [Triangularia verruculosa]
MTMAQTETLLLDVLATEKNATEPVPVHISLCGTGALGASNRCASPNGVAAVAGQLTSNLHELSGSKAAGDHSRLQSLAEEITANINGATTGNEPARLNIATAATELATAVRPPSDTIMSLFANMSIVSAIRVFQHWGVFDLIPSEPASSITCGEIARRIGAEEGIVYRISAMLTSSHILLTASPGELAHSPASLLLRSSEPMAAMFDLMYTNIVQVSDILPGYFDSYGRKEPVGPSHVPSTVLTGEPELEYFKSISRNEERMRNFTKAMKVTSGRVPVTGIYPLDRVLLSGENGRMAWVDVGGGAGHVLRRFREEYTVLRRSRCAVVDLKCVVEEGSVVAARDEVMEEVQWIKGDFMKEVPVKGARFYYLRHILRDYSDAVATLILRNVAQAMSHDSRVLISEQINPAGGDETGRPMPLYAAFKDYSMLAIGGKERCLDQFVRIGAAAGLKFEAVYHDSKGTRHGVVEFVLGS